MSLLQESESTLHELLTSTRPGKLPTSTSLCGKSSPRAQRREALDARAGREVLEYHDALYAEQSKWMALNCSRARALIWMRIVSSCLTRQIQSKIEADLEQGRKVGVAAHPVFRKRRFSSGAVPPADFEKIIDIQLARSAPRIHRSDVARRWRHRRNAWRGG